MIWKVIVFYLSLQRHSQCIQNKTRSLVISHEVYIFAEKITTMFNYQQEQSTSIMHMNVRLLSRGLISQTKLGQLQLDFIFICNIVHQQLCLLQLNSYYVCYFFYFIYLFIFHFTFCRSIVISSFEN